MVVTAQIPVDPQYPNILPINARSYDWFIEQLYPPGQQPAWMNAAVNTSREKKIFVMSRFSWWGIFFLLFRTNKKGVASSSMPIDFTFSNLLYSGVTYSVVLQVTSTSPAAVGTNAHIYEVAFF